jgi:hypothetical protein
MTITWPWRMFFFVLMVWMTKNIAAYMERPGPAQLKDYGPSMTYKDWDPNKALR